MLRRILLLVGFVASPMLADRCLAGTYTFTDIQDTRMPSFFTSFLGTPSINSGGSVAYTGNVTLPTGIRLAEIQVGNGKSNTTIAVTGGAVGGGVTYMNFPYSPTINNAGIVAFVAHVNVPGVAPGSAGVFTDSGNNALPSIIATNGPRSPYAAFLNSPLINNGNDVVYMTSLKAGPTAIDAAGPGLAPKIVAQTGPVFSQLTQPALNDGGTVSFFAMPAGANAYSAYRGNVLGNPPMLYPATPNFDFATPGAVNTNGVFVYSGRNGDLAQIATINAIGVSNTLAIAPGPDFQSLAFSNPSINASGSVAFAARSNAGVSGIYIDSSSGLSSVIAVGDPLFGSTVTSLSIGTTSLNANGQIAFLAGLKDGTEVVVRADAVPEPHAIWLLACGILVTIARTHTGRGVASLRSRNR